MVALLCASTGWLQAKELEQGGCLINYGGDGCLKADFDGNGVDDYVVPNGEGWIRVFLNHGKKTEQVIDIDAGGIAELYPPRSVVGPNGEPIVEHVSILVRWVGQEHVVYTWDGKGFKKVSFRSAHEGR